MNEQRTRVWCATGVFLMLLGLYLFTAPGRIDIIDGQWRYEAAKNWLDAGEPSIADPYLLATSGQLTNPRTGAHYAVYNAAPSLTPMPLMLLSRLLPGHRVERDQFAFSLAGPIFGALLGALLLLAYGWLGIALRPSLIYTGLFCMATLWWPASVTVFDQNQHALLMLGSLMLAWQSGRTRSPRLAGWAGLLAGLLLNYQEMYALVLPALGLAVLASPTEGCAGNETTLRQSLDRAGLQRGLTFGLGCCMGLALFFAFNEIRFGTPLMLGRFAADPTVLRPRTLGNPLAGFLGLAISPGKGILWFSPPLILALFGARRLWARAPALALAVGGASAIYLLVIILLTFFGGDWCWGPRYAIPVMPLWALALPFAPLQPGKCRRLLIPLAATGLLVQILGISLDQHRFFYERNLPADFWATDAWVYFRHSQLIARPREVLVSLTAGAPAGASRFNCSPTGQVTYCPFGPRHPELSQLWMRQFQLFYLPRPWWGWMGHVKPEALPVDPVWLGLSCGAMLALGGALLSRSLCARRADSRRDVRAPGGTSAAPLSALARRDGATIAEG